MREQGRGKSQRETSEAATEQNEESTTVAEQEEETDTVASGAELTEEMFIEENESPVETYEDVDYVEGRWSAAENEAGHLTLVDNARSALNNTYTFTQKEIDFFKMGAVFPDKAFPINGNKGKADNKCFHGGCGVNYIANYLYATQVAKSAGADCNIRVKGQNQDGFEYMKNLFHSKSDYYSDLSEVLSKKGYIIGSVTKSQQRMFLYGIASHIVTDCYAHSAFVKSGKYYKKIVETIDKVEYKDKNAIVGADDITNYPKRFTDAKTAMTRVLKLSKNNTMGSVLDFEPGKNRDYFLGNILKFANAANTSVSGDRINTAYKAINYTVNKDGDDYK